VSLIFCVGSQLLVSVPSLSPAACGVFFLLYLGRNYGRTHDAAYAPIPGSAGFIDVCLSMLPNGPRSTAMKLGRRVADGWEGLKAKVGLGGGVRPYDGYERMEGAGASSGDASRGANDDGDETPRDVAPQIRRSSLLRAKFAAYWLGFPRGPFEELQMDVKMEVREYFYRHKQKILAEHGHFLCEKSATQRENRRRSEVSGVVREMAAELPGVSTLVKPGVSTLVKGIVDTGGHVKAGTHMVKNQVIHESKKVSGFVTNPLATLMGPLQDNIGAKLLWPLRPARDSLSWADPFATAWIYALWVGMTAFAAIVALTGCMPIVVRTIDVALFGPHMYFVGQHLVKVENERAAHEEAFECMSAAKKEEQVKAYRDQLSTDFTEALLAAEDSRSPDVRARTFKKARVLNTCSVRLKVPSELGASRVVPSYAALRARSSARPSDSDMGADVV